MCISEKFFDDLVELSRCDTESLINRLDLIRKKVDTEVSSEFISEGEIWDLHSVWCEARSTVVRRNYHLLDMIPNIDFNLIESKKFNDEIEERMNNYKKNKFEGPLSKKDYLHLKACAAI
jgi:hypothetical protein